MKFSKLSSIRPSILLGEREKNRVGEKISSTLMQFSSPLFFGSLKKSKPIKAEHVAEAMIAIAENDFGVNIYESGQLMAIITS
jgi:hypothetical protein